MGRPPLGVASKALLLNVEARSRALCVHRWGILNPDRPQAHLAEKVTQNRPRVQRAYEVTAALGVSAVSSDKLRLETNVLRGQAPTAIAHNTNICLRGHELTESNTKRSHNGYRSCRTCVRRTENEWRRRIKEAKSGAQAPPINMPDIDNLAAG